MPAKGREHFEGYAPQTAVKHAILDKYFRAYLAALGPTVGAFHYIDGFAGRGTYGDGRPGSALRAITALAGQSKPASVSLIEADRVTFEALELAVRESLDGLVEPMVTNAEFSEVVGEVLTRPIYRRSRHVATFAFIDPCGVIGVRLGDIGQLLRLEFAECLLFWNYDGVNRLLGAVAHGTFPSEDLIGFFGGADVLNAALDCFRTQGDAGRKEVELRDLYVGALQRHAAARYIVPFRFRAQDRARTSHYLIHCSNHPLAFKIMKEVMWGLTAAGGDAGTYEFLRPDELGGQTSLFRPALDDARAAVLQELSTGDRPVSVFTKDWVMRPSDFLIEKQYKQVLLGLEAEGRIEVLDPWTRAPKPLDHRMKGGAPTLGAKLIVRRLPA
jgi:three-Cys-motif partner protein